MNDGVPYVLDGDLSVWEGDNGAGDAHAPVLKIYPGVTVKFPKDKTLTIGHDDGNHRGRLDAKGVTFTSLTTEGWNGIVIRNSAVDDSTYFSSSTIENSVTGVKLQNARPLIEKSTFRFNNTGISLNDASNDYAIGGADSRTNNFYNLSLIHISEPTRPY